MSSEQRREGDDASPPAEAHEAATHETRRQVGVALRNALKLGSSLLVTWAVGLYFNFAVPKHLGPEHYGILYSSESFTSAVFVVCGLGLDTYIQKSVATNPRHASDFFGTMMALRGALSALALGGMLFYQRSRHGSDETIAAVMMYGVTQIVLTLNASLTALLQSATKVGRLAVSNVVSKLLWGGGVLVALYLHAPVWLIIVPLFLTEVMKACVLAYIVRREMQLTLRLDVAATKKVLVASWPFFLNTATFTVGSFLDGAMMPDLASPDEVGWYGVARKFSGIAFLLSPLVNGIVMPLLTRARAESDEQFFAVLRRATEGLLVGAIPVTMVICLGADVWIRLVYHDRFDPAIASLRVLAPSILLTYMNVLMATALILLDREWPVTLVSIGSLAIQPLLIWFVVPWGGRTFGVGGAGLGNAMVFSFLELFSLVGFSVTIGRRGFDGRCVHAIVGSLFAFGLVALMDRQILALGPARIAVDCVVYTVVIYVTRTVRVSDVRGVIAIAMERRRARAAA
jgi:O-antigen/teichoic acid export membrane protein